MNKHLIAANWKSNGTKQEISAWCDYFVKHFAPSEEKRFCICPPHIYINQFHTQLISALPQHSPVSLGAQNISPFPQGAYTGEINGSMLQENSCDYVLIGHSERRAIFNESTDTLKQKMKQAREHKLKVIFCIGETHNEYKTGQSSSIIKEQLSAVLAVYDKESYGDLVIAYEPVWAIGTGLAAEPDYVNKMHATIQKELGDKSAVCVIYGGSINAENARDFLAMPNIAGLLVGGASLNAQQILTIYES